MVVMRAHTDVLLVIRVETLNYQIGTSIACVYYKRKLSVSPMHTRHASNDVRQPHQLEFGVPNFLRHKTAPPKPAHMPQASPPEQSVSDTAAAPVAAAVPAEAMPVAGAPEALSEPAVPVVTAVNEEQAEPAVPVATAVPDKKGPASFMKGLFARKKAQKGNVGTEYKLLTRSYANARL